MLNLIVCFLAEGQNHRLQPPEETSGGNLQLQPPDPGENPRNNLCGTSLDLP